MYGNDKKVVVQQSGMGLGTLCFFASLIFLILKVAGVISWSWWLVFAPLLVYAGLVVAILLIVLIVLGIVAIIMSRN
jgi:membrane protein YdbS with pleckstrin-like domain